VTSPPYWGLRDYGVDEQIGLESTLELYVEHLVAVFREVRRVLRNDGVVWLNLGDSYASVGKWGGSTGGKYVPELHGNNGPGRSRREYGNLKSKDLMGIPWRVVFALQADGWWLRSDVIWHKPNVMPESVTDRPTKSHEYVFLLSKSARYYYDQDAIREPQTGNAHSRGGGTSRKEAAAGSGIKSNESFNRAMTAYVEVPGGRNRRTVWTISTRPYSGAHFATFPPKLVEPMVLAGTSAKGQCPVCGKPWERVVERTGHINKRELVHVPNNYPTKTDSTGWAATTRSTNKWRPLCDHDAEPVPQVVLDPFAGTSTVGMVAVEHRRRFIGLELNPEYIALAQERTSRVQIALQMG